MLNLPFGLKDGRLLEVEQVSAGKACACRCPGCMAPLVAKKGRHKRHHFAHQAASACGQGLESALHLFTKQLLAQHGFLVLPPLLCDITGELLWPSRRLQFDELKTEPRLNGLIPDLIVGFKGRKLLIEIAVTHFAGTQKIEELERRNLPCLEIDASKLINDLCWQGSLFEANRFSNYVLFSQQYKKWLFHPKRKNHECQLFAHASHRQVKPWGPAHQRSFWVNRCPLKMNDSPGFYKHSGANVLRECINCRFCLEIKYDLCRRGGRTVPTTPNSVLCLGR